MWWVNFRRGGELAGTAIIEAPTIYHARLRLASDGAAASIEAYVVSSPFDVV
jgi:hypothetical protein